MTVLAVTCPAIPRHQQLSQSWWHTGLFLPDAIHVSLVGVGDQPQCGVGAGEGQHAVMQRLLGQRIVGGVKLTGHHVHGHRGLWAEQGLLGMAKPPSFQEAQSKAPAGACCRLCLAPRFGSCHFPTGSPARLHRRDQMPGEGCEAGLCAASPSCCVPVRHHMWRSKGSWGPGKGRLPPPRAPGLLAEDCFPGTGARLPPPEGTQFPGQPYPAPSTHTKLQQDLIQHLHGLHARCLGLLGQVLGLGQRGDSEGTILCHL